MIDAHLSNKYKFFSAPLRGLAFKGIFRALKYFEIFM
jgi:hypothetical protein